MMRFTVPILATILVAGPASAQQVKSSYTDLDPDRDCRMIERGEVSGSGALKCRGYGKYPVYIFADDDRETLYYGVLPPSGRTDWESFQGFNQAGPKIEWRLSRGVPFATIHRRFVTNGGERVEVLVVSHVSQGTDDRSCIVGYVVATGNQRANEQARQVADREARGFICGTDQPVVVAGRVPLPPVSRGE